MAQPTCFCRGSSIGAYSRDRRDHKLSSPSHRTRRESAIVLFFVNIGSWSGRAHRDAPGAFDRQKVLPTSSERRWICCRVTTSRWWSATYGRRMRALLHRADHTVLAHGVAFVLLEIRLCGVGFECASRLTFHPVERKTANFKHPLRLNITRSNLFLVG